MNLSLLKDEILRRFNPQKDYPCLFSQAESFRKEKPLRGKRVLHAAPLFFNTLPKLLPLLESDAELSVVPPQGLPYDHAALELLLRAGLDVRKIADADAEYDIVLDCIGQNANKKIKIGAVELTRSGESFYAQSSVSCISVDRSAIKLLEDLLGTSDGLVRALSSRGLNLQNKRVLLFGFGKVGRGVFFRLKELCAGIEVVEKIRDLSITSTLKLHDFGNKSNLSSLIDRADVIITATGVKHSLQEIAPESLIGKGKLLINIGAEDEYGTNIPSNEVFNQKAPANFILSEPTQLKYLDATFALHNQSAVDLLTANLGPGLHLPMKSSEEQIMNLIKNETTLWLEICQLGLESYFLSVLGC